MLDAVKCRLRALARGLPPGQEGADACKGEEQQADGDHDGVEEGGADGDFGAGDGLGDHGEHDAPEDGEGGGEEEQVVEQEAPFT